MAKYDIYLQKVAFDTDKTQYKIRPVIEVGKRNGKTIVAAITSHAPRHNAMGEYPIQNWSEAGLRSPSTIRLSKCSPMHPNAKYIGKLTLADIEGLEVLLKQKAEHDGDRALTDALNKRTGQSWVTYLNAMED